MILTLQIIPILLVAFTSGQDKQTHYKRFCYVTDWAQYRDGQTTFNLENVGATLCTHLTLAFASLDDSGTNLKATDPTDDPGLFKSFNAIKKGHPHLKTLLAVGGWNMGSELFSLLVTNNSNINTFANNAVKYLRDRGFDGLDIDWEYPSDRGSPPGDKQRFTTLIQTLHHTFRSEGNETGKQPLLLTAALSPFQHRVSQSYEATKLARYLDIINLMTYDMHGEWDKPLITGHHSALYGTTADPNLNIDALANYWAGMGVPKHKILIGLPFYGRTVSLNDTTVKGIGSAACGPGRQGNHTHVAGFLAYFEVCELLKNGAETHLITNQSVPYLVDNERWVGYDDEKSLQEKVKYVIGHGFGGVMVWALDLDDFAGICGKKYPLMHAIKDTINTIVGK